MIGIIIIMSTFESSNRFLWYGMDKICIFMSVKTVFLNHSKPDVFQYVLLLYTIVLSKAYLYSKCIYRNSYSSNNTVFRCFLPPTLKVLLATKKRFDDHFPTLLLHDLNWYFFLLKWFTFLVKDMYQILYNIAIKYLFILYTAKMVLYQNNFFKHYFSS